MVRIKLRSYHNEILTTVRLFEHPNNYFLFGEVVGIILIYYIIKTTNKQRSRLSNTQQTAQIGKEK
jgi:hypothetical protein